MELTEQEKLKENILKQHNKLVEESQTSTKPIETLYSEAWLTLVKEAVATPAATNDEHPDNTKHVPQTIFVGATGRIRGGKQFPVHRVLDFLFENPEKAYSIKALAEKFGVRPTTITAYIYTNWRGYPFARRLIHGEHYIGLTEELTIDDIKRLKARRETVGHLKPRRIKQKGESRDEVR